MSQNLIRGGIATMARTVRQNCRWIPSRVGHEFLPGPSDEHDDYAHPDFLRLLRGLAAYEQWVSERLIPIVSKWIDEHREEVTRSMSDEEMNDMGAAVEAAYALIAASEWMQERQKAAADFNPDVAEINPLWRRKTEEYINAERSVSQKTNRP
jgi:hypothetical protein